MALIGYARVSTKDQETRLQLDALRRAGVRRIFEEKASGADADRPVLRECFESLRAGDVFVFWRIDRVARSLRALLDFEEELRGRGVGLRSLCEPIDTTTPIGEYLFHNLGAVAQLERRLIRERVIAGQVAAIERGVRHGRPRVLTSAQSAVALKLLAAGETQAAVARQFGVSRGAVDRLQNPWRPRYAENRPVLGPLLKSHGSAL